MLAERVSSTQTILTRSLYQWVRILILPKRYSLIGILLGQEFDCDLGGNKYFFLITGMELNQAYLDEDRWSKLRNNASKDTIAAMGADMSEKHKSNSFYFPATLGSLPCLEYHTVHFHFLILNL